MEKSELSYTVGMDVKWSSHFEEHSGNSSNGEYRIPYDPTIQLLGVYPEEMKTYVHTKTYTQMLTAVLFTTAKKVETTQISINWQMHK